MVPKIQCVCGFGCGSSLMLRMAIDDILHKHNLEADTFCGDVGTCLSNPCDVIFISRELAERIEDRATVPVVI
ncbi:MAG: PTS sugar transporter subunit IIB, partial [Erysipelotrichaceae bacterium]|nr:PTS sugar transporter subunit IIB [Erysipelotrichaceae bacterium]